MRIVKVDSIPKKAGTRHDLQDIIKRFVDSDAKFCKLELADGEYKSLNICYNCMHVAVKRSGTNIHVRRRGDEIYLVKE